jgi:hypothetical protein
MQLAINFSPRSHNFIAGEIRFKIKRSSSASEIMLRYLLPAARIFINNIAATGQNF